MEVTVCYIVATDGDTYKVSSGIVDQDKWHPIAMDHSFSVDDKAEEFPDGTNIMLGKLH